MRREIKANAKKILSLLLAASLTLTMDMSVFADDTVEFEDSPIVVEEFESEPEYLEESQDEIIVENDFEYEGIAEESNPEVCEFEENEIVVDEDDVVVDEDEFETEDVIVEDGEFEGDDIVSEDDEDDEYVKVSYNFGKLFLLPLNYTVNFPDDSDDPDAGIEFKNNVEYEYVKKSSLLAVESLVLYPINDNGGGITLTDLDELTVFENLKNLEIDSKDKIIPDLKKITFPDKLERLKINNCKFIKDSTAEINLSKLTNLKELVITDNNHVGGNITITGLANLKNLEVVRFDRSPVTNLTFASSLPEGAKGQIKFSAVGCDSLTTLDFGAYKLINGYDDQDKQYAPSLCGCKNLASVTINGIADREKQTLDMSKCSKLATVNVNYDFTNTSFSAGNADGNILVVDTTNNYLKTGNANFTVTSNDQNQPTGHYELNTYEGCYFESYANNNRDLFTKVDAVKAMVDYILFDVELFLYNKFGVRRNYEKKPIVLRLCEEVTNDVPHFYNKDRIEIDNPDLEFSITLENTKIPEGKTDSNNQVVTVSGLTLGQAKTFKKSELDTLKLKANAVGEAKLTITWGSGDNQVTAVQNIIVAPPVTGVSIEKDDKTGTFKDGENECLYRLYDTVDGVGSGDYNTFKFGVMMQIAEDQKEMVDNTLGNLNWLFYKQDGNGWKNTHSYSTPEGLSIDQTSMSSETNIRKTYKGSDGAEVVYGYDPDLKDGQMRTFGMINFWKSKFEGGRYKIKGWCSDNETTPTNQTKDLNSNNVENVYPNLVYWTEELVFDFINVVQSNTVIKYGFGYNSVNEVYFTASDIEGFKVSAEIALPDEIVNETDPVKKDNLAAEFRRQCEENLDLHKVDVAEGETEETSGRKYRLAFKDGISEDAKGDFIKYLYDVTWCWVPVDITVSNSDKDYSQTFRRSVRFYGQFDIEYDAKGGEIPSNSPRSYYLPGNSYPYLNPTRTGYNFDGWYSNGKKVNDPLNTPGGKINLVAHWKGKTYTNTLKFDANGGTGAPAAKSGDVTFPNTQKTFTIPTTVPKKDKYTFAGWYTSKTGGTKYSPGDKVVAGSKSIAQNQTLTLYAQWIGVEYKIKFNGNGSTSGSMSTLNCNYGKQSVLTANAYKKSYYEFGGWNTKADGTGKSYANKATVKNLADEKGKVVTLYAQWKPAKYTITYNLNGGTNSTKNPATYTIKSKDITFVAPTRKGYNFNGWYKDSKFKSKRSGIKQGSHGNITIYAKWTAIKYTVKFDANGGSGTMKNQSMKYDKAASLTKNAFKKSGYSFLGWSKDKKAKTATYKNAAQVKNLSSKDGGVVTLYAVWKK